MTSTSLIGPIICYKEKRFYNFSQIDNLSYNQYFVVAQQSNIGNLISNGIKRQFYNNVFCKLSGHRKSQQDSTVFDLATLGEAALFIISICATIH